MVFRKNMIRNFFVSNIIILFFFAGCGKKEYKITESKYTNYNIISLNIFEYNFISKDKKYKLSDELGFSSSFLLDRVTSWGNKKFKVKGENKKLLFTLEELALVKKKIKKNKGLIKLLFSDEETQYNLSIKISLKFYNESHILETLNLNGNINFIIKDNYSIIQKKKYLNASYLELISKVDEAIDREFKKKTFSKFKFI